MYNQTNVTALISRERRQEHKVVMKEFEIKYITKPTADKVSRHF